MFSEMQMLQQPATHYIVLYTQRVIEIRTVKLTFFSKQIAHAAGDLAADGDPAVTVFHPATLHDDVLAGCVQPPPIGVASGLDRDTVVPGVEVTCFYQHVGTRFRIAAVVIWTMTVDLHVLHDHVAAEHRMDFPHRRVLNRDAVDQHVLTTIRLNELRPQIMTLAKHTFAHGNASFSHAKQRVSIGTLVAHAFFPTVLRTSVPLPPVFVVTLSIERTSARDGDVSLFERVNERRVVEEFDAFPAREDYGQVVIGILAKLHDRAA